MALRNVHLLCANQLKILSNWARVMHVCLPWRKSKLLGLELRCTSSPIFSKHFVTNTAYSKSLHEQKSRLKYFWDFVRCLTESKSDQNQRSCQNQTVEIVCKGWTEVLEKNNIPEAEVSVGYIIAHVLGRKTMHGIPGTRKLDQQQIEKVNSMCQERLQHKPVQYILGEWDFHDIELKMKPPVFIPRPETEELVDWAIHVLESRQSPPAGRLLELCCGSGAITLSLLCRFPLLQGVAVDITPEACDLTEENAQRLGVSDRITVLKGDLTDLAVQGTLRDMGPFDLLLSNPPYVPSGHMSSLEPHVLQYEDHRALDGGTDGMDIIRHILHLSPQLLKSQSDILLEIHPGQPMLICDIMTSMEAGALQYISSYQDYCQRERFCHLRTQQTEPCR